MHKTELPHINHLIKLTLRYIWPCPPAVPLSSTDWLIVDVAEAPIGRLLVVDPDPDVTLTWRTGTCIFKILCGSKEKKRYWFCGIKSYRFCMITYCGCAGSLRRATAGGAWLTTGSQSGLKKTKKVKRRKGRDREKKQLKVSINSKQNENWDVYRGCCVVDAKYAQLCFWPQSLHVLQPTAVQHRL